MPLSWQLATSTGSPDRSPRLRTVPWASCFLLCVNSPRRLPARSRHCHGLTGQSQDLPPLRESRNDCRHLSWVSHVRKAFCLHAPPFGRHYAWRVANADRHRGLDGRQGRGRAGVRGCCRIDARRFRGRHCFPSQEEALRSRAVEMPTADSRFPPIADNPEVSSRAGSCRE